MIVLRDDEAAPSCTPLVRGRQYVPHNAHVAGSRVGVSPEPSACDAQGGALQDQVGDGYEVRDSAPVAQGDIAVAAGGRLEDDDLSGITYERQRFSSRSARRGIESVVVGAPGLAAVLTCVGSGAEIEGVARLRFRIHSRGRHRTRKTASS